MFVTVEVIREGAFNLLSDMEHLDLIRVNAPEKNTVEPKKKLSGQFAGALRLSDTAYVTYQNAIQEGRNEWHRDIC